LVKAIVTLSTDYDYHLFVAETRRAALPPPPSPQCHWHTTRLSRRWLERLWYRLQLPLPIERWTGDLALFHAPDFVLPPTLPATKTVVTIHDLSFVHFPHFTMPGMLRYLNKWVPASVQRADHVIAVSEATRQDLIELYHTPPEKISVLYHGVGAEFMPINTTQQQAIRQKYNLSTQPYFISVGTIQPRKNYITLIKAFNQLPPEARALKPLLLIIGGRGWHDEATVAAMQAQANIRWLGFVPDTDLPALYRAATALVYPSYYEGFGLPVLEAMVCGTPIISANTSALPEVVGQAGFLVDPHDWLGMAANMAELLLNKELYQRLSRASLAQATQFSWTTTAQQLLRLYQNLLA
jgi:glycosyltransferase involved in cell wall biosynthesis